MIQTARPGGATAGFDGDQPPLVVCCCRGTRRPGSRRRHLCRWAGFTLGHTLPACVSLRPPRSSYPSPRQRQKHLQWSGRRYAGTGTTASTVAPPQHPSHNANPPPFLVCPAACKNEKVAMALAPAITVILILFGGFYVNEDTIPVWLRWIKWLSHLYWVREGSSSSTTLAS